MRQGKLAGGKRAHEIQLQQVAELLRRKIVNRSMRRMPAGVVDQTINTPRSFDSLRDQVLDVRAPGDITRDELRSASFGRCSMHSSALIRFADCGRR